MFWRSSLTVFMRLSFAFQDARVIFTTLVNAYRVGNIAYAQIVFGQRVVEDIDNQGDTGTSQRTPA